MKRSLKWLPRVFGSVVLIAAFAATSTTAFALKDTFENPTYKRKARLDVCFTWGQNCGQKAADTYCWAQGYDRATNFTSEPHRPTRLGSNGKVCDADFCVGFKTITCFIPGSQLMTNRGWPTPLD